MADRYWVGGNANWDATAGTKWALTSGGAGGEAVPTSGDNVFLDNGAGTGNVTITANAACRSLDCTGYVGVLTHNASVTVSIGDGTPGPGNVALKLVAGMTYTKTGGSSSILAFVSTSGTQQTIDYGGKTVSGQTFNGAGGSWILLSDMTRWTAGQGFLTLTTGSLDTNGQTITMASVSITGTSARSLTLGSSNVILDATFAGVWTAAVTTLLTFSGASSTITISGAGGAGTELFRGGGLSYGTLNLTGTGIAIITGDNSFVNLTRSNAAACQLTLPVGTQIVSGTLAISGTPGNLVTVVSRTSPSPSIISKPSGTVIADYVSLQDQTATGGATFYAGSHSTNVSGNTGWIFSGPNSEVMLVMGMLGTGRV